MRRHRKGQIWRPPSAAESAAVADAIEAHKASPSQPIDLPPVGQDIVVKTPVAGIAARDGATISSALCDRCIEVNSTSNEKTLVDTDEKLRIYNIYPDAVTGEVYVVTSLTLHGTRYVNGEPC